jgi:hypothetical protein
VCGAVGCGDSLEVKFEVSVPQTYDVEISVPEGQTLRLHCEGSSTEVISNPLPEVVPLCLWNEGLAFQNFTPVEVTITLLAGNHRVSQTFKPSYETYRVNGSCDPECRASKVSFTTPLDTSPKALAQTATARPVMIEVNRALLQATIIDATSMAMRSNPALAPATATALTVEVEGLFATIEALRPTADSLQIVLVQRAVQPTDAPEATLFAQASEASAAASRSLVGTPTPIVPTRQ